MALKNRFYAIILSLGLTFWACSAPTLGDIPSYDADTVNSHYLNILEHETMYFQLMRLMVAGFVPEARKAESEKILDRYIYYSAVAKIHVFNGRWAESDEADAKSADALVDLIKILQSDAI